MNQTWIEGEERTKDAESSKKNREEMKLEEHASMTEWKRNWIVTAFLIEGTDTILRKWKLNCERENGKHNGENFH
jgi:hypothetical protein